MPKDSQRSSPPKAVVARLSLYLREVEQLRARGIETVNSKKLAELLDLTDANVRKDLSYFGKLGYPGVGYRCQELAREFKRILGTNRIWPVVLVGCGNLGTALLGHNGFREKGFQIVAAFDKSAELVGQTINGINVLPMEKLTRKFCRQNRVELAILAVPAEAAEPVASQIVQCGIKGILNFAPVSLMSHGSIKVAGVDLAIELEQLSFAVVKQLKSP